jgi:hypothetical protein
MKILKKNNYYEYFEINEQKYVKENLNGMKHTLDINSFLSTKCAKHFLHV